jgi:hypothetical protein
METATGSSTHENADEAIGQAYELARREISHEANLIALYATPNYSGTALLEYLRQVEPRAQVIGCTTHKGVLTDRGWHSESNRGLGLMLLSDDLGSFGVAAQGLSTAREAREISAKITEEACASAGRPGELPSHILVHSTIGYEEEVLLGIQDSIGTHTPITGGTAADLTLDNQWSVFATDTVLSEGLVIAALYPSTAMYNSASCGYSSTPHKGYVTRREGRILHEIDNRPALEVYNEWSQEPFPSHSPGLHLHEARLNPIGTPLGDLGTVPFYRLAQPIRILEGGSVELACEVHEGDLLFLMEGTEEEVLFGPSSLTANLRELQGFSEDQEVGILFMSSAGSLPSERSMIESMGDLIKLQSSAPFIMPFSFAEQGSLSQGININSNLMVSCLMATNKGFPGFRRLS